MEIARKNETAFQGGRSVPARLSSIVGENLRHFRRLHGLSLEQLAQLSGVSRAMLGQIETGKSAPTINLLGRIAEALKISVSALIASPGSGGTIIITREAAMVLTMSNGRYSSRTLFPLGDPRAIEIYEVALAPDHQEFFEALASGARKALVLLSGEIELVIGGGAPTRLSVGDAVLFSSDTAHSLRNLGRDEAKAFLVVAGADAPVVHHRPS